MGIDYKKGTDSLKTIIAETINEAINQIFIASEE